MSRLMMITLLRDGQQTPVASEVSHEVGGCVGRRPVQGSAGFTLVELVLTLAVIGVLASMAIPTTVNALHNYRLTAAVSAATGAISATRFQAIMHAYPYQITFNSTNATYQVASEVPPATSFTNVGSAIPISGGGDITINQTTTLQFNANGTVLAIAGPMSFTISNVNGPLTNIISVTGVGDVSSNWTGVGNVPPNRGGC